MVKLEQEQLVGDSPRFGPAGALGVEGLLDQDIEAGLRGHRNPSEAAAQLRKHRRLKSQGTLRSTERVL